jgi:hypothetical protein
MQTASKMLPPVPNSIVFTPQKIIPPHYDPTNVQLGLFWLGGAIFVLALLVLYGHQNKAERAGYMLVFCAAFTTIMSDAGLPAVLFSYSAGLLLAAFITPPYWLWRAAGNKASVFVAGTASILVMIVASLSVPPPHPVTEALRFIEGGAALLFFTCANQGWTVTLKGQVIKSPFYLLSALILFEVKGSTGTLTLLGIGVLYLAFFNLFRELSAYAHDRRIFREDSQPYIVVTD